MLIQAKLPRPFDKGGRVDMEFAQSLSCLEGVHHQILALFLGRGYACVAGMSTPLTSRI